MRAFLLVSLLLVPAVAAANDGRNRYEGTVPASLTHLHAPLGPEAGFRVLAADMAGGADGDPAFRWAQRHAIALVRLAARRTVVAFGPGPYPLAIFDLTSENADTPVEMTPKGPRGRHPGGSHDGGMNLDLGYYLSSEKGKVETPDPAACTEHYGPAGADGKPKEENWCTGPIDRLDVDRTSLFLLEAVKTHVERFDRALLEQIGIDARVRLVVLERLRAWAKAKRFGATPTLVAELDRLFASSPYEGWARFHHHHVHLRFATIDAGGRHGRAIDQLETEDRALEAELLVAQKGKESHGDVALLAELHTMGLERSIDLRLGGALGRVKAVRFRADGGPWGAPEGMLEPHHHELDVPRVVDWTHRTATVEAEVTFADGGTHVLSRQVALPRQPGFLSVKIEAQRVIARAKPGPGGFWVSVDLPPAYRTLVTAVEWVFHRKGAAPVRVVAKDPDASLRVFASQVAPDDVELVEVELVLSGRMRIRIAGYARPRTATAPAS